MDLISEKTTLPKVLDMEMTEIHEGFCRVDMPLEDKHMNLFGGIHGGSLFSLADNAAGMATRTYVKNAVTLSATFNFLAAAPEGTRNIFAEARVVRRGRTIIVLDTQVYAGEKLIANGSFTFYVTEK